MTDKEKVITGFEDSLANNGCGFMDGIGELFAVSGEDLQNALALLKAQEARLMSVIEVDTWVSTKRIEREPIVIEVRDRYIAWIVCDEYGDLPGANLSREFYGKTYRCWTSRPTKEQINEVAWDE